MALTMSSKSHIRIEGTEMENDWMRFNIDISEQVLYHQKDAVESLKSNAISRNPGGGLRKRIEESAMSLEEPNKFYAQSRDILHSDHKPCTTGCDRHKEYAKNLKQFHNRTNQTAWNHEGSPEGNGTWFEALGQGRTCDRHYAPQPQPQLQPQRQVIREPRYEPDLRGLYPQENDTLRAQAFVDPRYGYPHRYYQNRSVAPKQYHESHCPARPHNDHSSYSKVLPIAPQVSPTYGDFNLYSEVPSRAVCSKEYLVPGPNIPVYRQLWEQRRQVPGAVPTEYPSNCRKIYGTSDPHGPVYEYDNGEKCKEQAPGGTPREFSGNDYYDARHHPRKHSPKRASPYYDTYETSSLQYNAYENEKSPTNKSNKYYKDEVDAEDDGDNFPANQFYRYHNKRKAGMQCHMYNYTDKKASPKRERRYDKKNRKDSPGQGMPVFKEEVPHRNPNYEEKKKQQLRREHPSKLYKYFSDIPQPLKYSPDYTINRQKSNKISKTSPIWKRSVDDGSEIPHNIFKYSKIESPIVPISTVEIPYKPHKIKSAPKGLDAGCDSIPSSPTTEHDAGRNRDRKTLKDRISRFVKKSKPSRSHLFNRRSLLLKGFKPANAFNFSSTGSRYPTVFRGQGQEHPHVDKGRKFQEYSMFNVLQSSKRSRVNTAQSAHCHTENLESSGSSNSCSICDKYSRTKSCGNRDDSSMDNFSANGRNSSTQNCTENNSASSMENSNANYRNSSNESYTDNYSDSSMGNCSANRRNSGSDNYGCNRCGNNSANLSNKCMNCANCKRDENECNTIIDPIQPSQINICLTIRAGDNPTRGTTSESKSPCNSTPMCRVKPQPSCQKRVSQPPKPSQSCRTGVSSRCHKEEHRDAPRSDCGEKSFKKVRLKCPRTSNIRNQSTTNQSCHEKESPNKRGCTGNIEGKSSRPQQRGGSQCGVRNQSCLKKTDSTGNMAGKSSRSFQQRGSPRNSRDVGTTILEQDKKQSLSSNIKTCNRVQARSEQRGVASSSNGCSSGRNTRSSCTGKSMLKNSTTSLSSGSSSSSHGKKRKENPLEYVCYPPPLVGDNTCPEGPQTEYNENFSVPACCNTTGPIQCGELCCPKLVAEWDQRSCRRKNTIEDLKQELLQNLRNEQQPDGLTRALGATQHMMCPIVSCVPGAPCQPNASPFACWSPSPVVSWSPCSTLQAPCSP